eukprot:7389288-Prymnesium_polylepis.5
MASRENSGSSGGCVWLVQPNRHLDRTAEDRQPQRAAHGIPLGSPNNRRGWRDRCRGCSAPRLRHITCGASRSTQSVAKRMK